MVAENPSFSWDEDSEVRDMLCAVFHEEEDDVSSNVQSGGPVQIDVETGGCSNMDDVQLLEVGELISASRSSVKADSFVAGGGQTSDKSKGVIVGHDAVVTLPEDFMCSVSESEAVGAIKRRRGRPKKSEQGRNIVSCTVKDSTGAVTQSKSLPSAHNSFAILSNEEDLMEC